MLSKFDLAHSLAFMDETNKELGCFYKDGNKWFEMFDGTFDNHYDASVGYKSAVELYNLETKLSMFTGTFVEQLNFFMNDFIIDTVKAVVDTSTREVLQSEYGLWDRLGSIECRFQMVKTLVTTPLGEDILLSDFRQKKRLKAAGLLEHDVRRLMHNLWSGRIGELEAAHNKATDLLRGGIDRKCPNFRFNIVDDLLRQRMWPTSRRREDQPDEEWPETSWLLENDRGRKDEKDLKKLCNLLGAFVYQFPIYTAISHRLPLLIHDLKLLNAVIEAKVKQGDQMAQKVLAAGASLAISLLSAGAHAGMGCVSG